MYKIGPLRCDIGGGLLDGSESNKLWGGDMGWIWEYYWRCKEIDVWKVKLGIKFMYRESNNIAHRLAKLALAFSDERVWIKDGPI